MMQAGEFGLSWTQFMGGMLGCVAVAGALSGVLWHRQRRRHEINERPPQEEKILRPAGYFAMRQVEEHQEELLWAILQALGAGMIFGVVLGGLWPLVAGLALGRFTIAQVWAAPKSDVLVAAALSGLVGFLWFVRQFQRVCALSLQVRHWRFGLRGEQAVAEKLADRTFAAAGYVAFHDVPARNGKREWNVDHVVVGPGGVFVLETKARSKRKATRDQEESKVVFDGQTLQFPWCEDRNVVGQVRRNADWVRELIREFAPEGILVQPVIVVPGWYVESKGNYPVKAMNAKYLVGFLTGAKVVYGEKDLRGIRKKLDEVCRDLEF
jgi:hypothetical protein